MWEYVFVNVRFCIFVRLYVCLNVFWQDDIVYFPLLYTIYLKRDFFYYGTTFRELNISSRILKLNIYL